MSLSGGDNVDIMSDMYYKFLVHDCMWSGACKEDNTHETTNKFSDFSYFSTSPVYGSIFDIFNIDDENSLEINCDPEYDTSDQDDSPLSGLSPENTQPVDDENLLLNPSCSSSPTPSTSSSISTLTGSTLISPAGLVSDASTSSSSSSSSPSTSSTPITIIKPTTSRATSTGKSASTSKSTLSSKATKSSSKAKSTSISNSRATTSTVAATSLVNPTISQSATVTTLINSNSSLINTTNTTTPSTTLGSSINSVSAIGTTTTTTGPIGTPATIASAASAAGVASTTSILKTTGKARNSKSLYPERRKEHNNSEKKRRDHLRNAFNHLRDQIPKLKDGEKKAARVTILKESVSYVTLLKEKHRYLERTKNAETIKHENLLKRLKMLQSSTGASVDIKDPNIVYVQCNSSNVC